MTPKDLVKKLFEFVNRERTETTPTIALLKSERILRRVLEI